MAGLLRCKLRIYIGSIKYFCRYMLSSPAEVIRVYRLKDKMRGKSAFVFGNGPSLKAISGKKIRKILEEQKFHLIATNGFLDTPHFRGITPNFMIFSDPLDFRPIRADTKRLYRATQGQADLKRAIDKKITLFIPFKFKEYIGPSETKVHYFNDSENIFSRNVDNIIFPRGYSSWTGHKALAIAQFLGYSHIYICGLDYDSIREINVDQENRVFWKVAHFNDSNERPAYIFEKSSEGRSVSDVLFNSFLNISTFEKFSKEKIVNLNPHGLIDSFSKKHDLDVYIEGEA